VATRRSAEMRVRDRGQVVDPLVGRRRPVDCQLGGRGLCVVNQLSGLVQVRSSPSGTTMLRAHVLQRQLARPSRPSSSGTPLIGPVSADLRMQIDDPVGVPNRDMGTH
jgi:hypothetical protein